MADRGNLERLKTGDDSITDVIKVADNPALLDPNKTEGRRHRGLLFDIIDTVVGTFQRLTSNQIRGLDQRVRNLTKRDAIAKTFLVLGMRCAVSNNVTQAQADAGVDAGSAEYVLLRDSTGPLVAFVDAEPDTTDTALCRWVLASGTFAQIVGSYPPFKADSQPYAIGDVVRYNLNGTEALFQALKAMPLAGGGIYNPAPTGDPTDSNWFAFVPDGLDLAPATTTTLGGIRVGDGLSVEPDGLLSAEVQLKKPNVWEEIGDYSAKGLKLPAGAKVDEGGSAFFQRLDIGQRHYTFGRYHSLGAQSIIQWKDTEFINQDGDGDVGLARVGPGELEVNNGTPSFLANIRAYDVLGLGAPSDYNSIIKLGLAVQNVAHVPGAKILWVQGGLQSYQPARGVRSRPYETAAAAQAAAQDGDDIVIRIGGSGRDAFGRAYYTDSFLWEKNVRIIFEPGAIFGGLFQLAAFNALTVFTKRTLIGGEFLGRVLLWRQSSSDCDVLLINVRFSGIGYFEVNGAGSYNNAYVTKAVLRNCIVDSNLGASDYGAVRFIGRDDMGPVLLELDNTLVISPQAPCLTFQANEASVVRLLGTTELRGPDKIKNLVTSPSGYQIPESTWLQDSRPVGSSTGPGTPGVSSFGQLNGQPRDNAALNQELNAVNSLADNRRDLPTIASNRFNDLVLETKVIISQLELKTNASGVSAQVLQGGSIAVSSPRTGSPADVLAAIQADINGLGSYDYYIIRFQTTPGISTDVTHVLLTISKA